MAIEKDKGIFKMAWLLLGCRIAIGIVVGLSEVLNGYMDSQRFSGDE